jgi:hypothetical protein
MTALPRPASAELLMTTLEASNRSDRRLGWGPVVGWLPLRHTAAKAGGNLGFRADTCRRVKSPSIGGA